MKKSLKLILLVFLALAISCKDEQIIPLPEEVQIQVATINVFTSADDPSITFSATIPEEGLTGVWSIENDDFLNPGRFKDTNDPSTVFAGDPYTEYLIKWTISNGNDARFDTAKIILRNARSYLNINTPISILLEGGFSSKTLLDNGVSVQELLNESISIQKLIQEGASLQLLINNGATIQQLTEAGVQIRDLFENTDLTTLDFLNAGAPINELLLLGIDASELLDFGVNVAELAATNAVLVGDLIEYGISDSELTSNGLIGEVEDYEGYRYKWVKIGEQKWLAENVRSRINRDGNPMQSYVYDGLAENLEIYGRLYSYTTSVSICPDGWHLPKLDEWSQLEKFLGQGTFPDKIYGDRLKSKGSLEEGDGLWKSKHEGNNRSGFNFLPGGKINYSNHHDISMNGYFHYDQHFTWPPGYNLRYKGLSNLAAGVKTYGGSSNNGTDPKLSVRCLCDE